MLNWCRKKSYEAQANQCARASILRQFAKHLDSIGVEAYVIPKGFYPSEQRYIPYIYTQDELSRFFAKTNQCRESGEFPHRHRIMPVLFRMLYLCGLRVSEARLLKVGDVDLENGILHIQHSKKDNSRLVPMSDALSRKMPPVFKKGSSFSSADDGVSSALGGKPMTIGNVYKTSASFCGMRVFLIVVE